MYTHGCRQKELTRHFCLPEILERIKIEERKCTKYKVNTSLDLIKHHVMKTYGGPRH
jgi:hypothetical protein